MVRQLPDGFAADILRFRRLLWHRPAAAGRSTFRWDTCLALRVRCYCSAWGIDQAYKKH